MTRSRIIAGKAVIIIEARDQIDKSLGKIRGKLNAFANTVGALGQASFTGGFFGSIASGFLVTSFIKFDDALRTVRVNLGLFGKTAQEVEAVMKPLEKSIRSLAKSTPFTPVQVAETAVGLAKGGFNAEEIKKSLKAVLDLARATGTELGTATNFLIKTITTYGISVDETSETISKLVRATRKGVLNIDDLEAAMRYSSGTADALGVSLEKMLALITVLSNRGLVGSIAGTSTNTALAQLVRKAEEIQTITGKPLVIGIRDADGRQAVDVFETLKNLFKETSKYSIAKQVTTFQGIFNLRGSRTIQAIRDELDNIKDLTDFIAAAGNEGALQSAIKDAGPGGALRRLVSTVQELAIALGQTTESTFTPIANGMKAILEEINKLSATNPALTALIIFSPGILIGAGLGLLAIAKAARITAGALTILRAAYQPISRLLVRGVTGQIATVAGLTARRTPPPLTRTTSAQRINQQLISVRRLAASQAAATSNVVRAARGRALTAARRRLRASRTAAARLPPSATGIGSRLARSRSIATNARADAGVFRNRSLIHRHVAATNQALSDQFTTRANVSLNRVQAIHARQLATIADRTRQVNIARARGAGLLQLNTQRLTNVAARYRQQLVLDRQLISLRQQLASVRTQSRFLPSARLLIPRIQAQIRAANLARNALNQRVGGRFTGVTPAQEQARLLRQRSVLAARDARQAGLQASLARGRATAAARLARAQIPGQDLLIRAGGFRQIAMIRAREATAAGRYAAGLRRTALAAEFSHVGVQALRAGRSILELGSTLLRVANVARRFVFSFSGIFTILELLFLFGGKVPAIASVFDRFGAAFSGAFREIGRVAIFAKGPIDLLKASFSAFKAGEGDLGFTALKNGLVSLKDIIGSQLVAAWARFKEKLGPVWDTIRGIASSIKLMLDFTVELISIGVGEAFASLGDNLRSLVSLFGGDGDKVDFGAGIQAGAKAMLQAFVYLSTKIAEWSLTIRSVLDDFIGKLERAFLAGATAFAATLPPGLSWVAMRRLATLSTEERARSDATLARRLTVGDDIRQLGEDNLAGIERIFAQPASEAASKGVADTAAERSAQLDIAAERNAAGIRQQLADRTTLAAMTIDDPTPTNQNITTKTISEAAKIMLQSAHALVGSAQSTRQNVLRFEKIDVEKQQLDVLKGIRDNTADLGSGELAFE